MATVANLVWETSISNGSSDLTLSAAAKRFSDAFSTGSTEDVFPYFIVHRTAEEWEYGTGHMSDANTLVRDTVIESSNSNAAVSFSAGIKDVTNAVPAGTIMQTTNNLSDVSSAATAFGNIKQAATDSATGVVEKATAAEIKAGTSDKFPDAAGVLSAMAWATITAGASPTVNHASGVNQKITHSANATMGAPSNAKAGWPLNIWIVPGAYTTAWNAVYKFGDEGAPDIDAEGVACFICLDSSNYVFLGFRKKA